MKWAGVRLINEERKQKDESVRRGEHLAAKKKKKIQIQHFSRPTKKSLLYDTAINR